MWKISYLFLFTLLLATTAYAAPKKIKADACGIVFHGWVEPETIVHAKASQTQIIANLNKENRQQELAWHLNFLGKHDKAQTIQIELAKNLSTLAKAMRKRLKNVLLDAKNY